MGILARLRASCSRLIRSVVNAEEAIDIECSNVIACLAPRLVVTVPTPRAWERLRGSGELLAGPEESVLQQEAFEASR